MPRGPGLAGRGLANNLQRRERTNYLGTSRQAGTIRFLREGAQDSRQGTAAHTRTGVADIMSAIRTFAIRISDSAFALEVTFSLECGRRPSSRREAI
jgi:hypothetical protein